MKNNIFIPQRINVGFQNRDDTYTKKLAYVIYYDQKNVLRKEASWNSWRDEKIEPMEFENVPISGFVLNKKVGGYSSGWNHRQTYTRIYDPRDFEFEITVPNLLYILENTNSIKGKGLEGEFVYGWDGKDLILIPTSSPDYEELTKFNDALYRKQNYKGKDLIIGAKYQSSNNEEYVYMGNFDEYSCEWGSFGYNNKVYYNKGKTYWFHKDSEGWNGNKYSCFFTLKSIGNKIIDVINENCVENYSELFELMGNEENFNPPVDITKDKYIQFDTSNFDLNKISYFFSKENESYVKYNVRYRYNRGWGNYSEYNIEKENSRRNIEIMEDRIGSRDIERLLNKYKPLYLQQYTKNNKPYKKGAE